MNKMMTDHMHDRLRSDLAEWSEKHGIAKEAKAELLRLIFGKPTLIKRRP